MEREVLNSKISFLLEISPALAVLDAKNPAQSTTRTVQDSLETLQEIGLRLHEDTGLQAFFQYCKCIGLEFHQMGIQAEVLLGLLGAPGVMCENMENIDKQDASIRR